MPLSRFTSPMRSQVDWHQCGAEDLEGRARPARLKKDMGSRGGQVGRIEADRGRYPLVAVMHSYARWPSPDRRGRRLSGHPLENDDRVSAMHPTPWHRPTNSQSVGEAGYSERMPKLVSPRQVQLDTDSHLNYFFG
jgi:hypothetical protein